MTWAVPEYQRIRSPSRSRAGRALARRFWIWSSRFIVREGSTRESASPSRRVVDAVLSPTCRAHLSSPWGCPGTAHFAVSERTST
jgi:hypothetical protein